MPTVPGHEIIDPVYCGHSSAKGVTRGLGICENVNDSGNLAAPQVMLRQVNCERHDI